MFNLLSCIPSARFQPAQQSRSTHQPQSTPQTRPAPAARSVQQAPHVAREPVPTLHMARFRSGPAQRKHYNASIVHAVKHLDTVALEQLLENPPYSGRLTRVVAVNQEVPAGYPGARPADTLLHVLADPGADSAKAARAILMLVNKDADPNASNDSLETPAMRAVEGFQQLQLVALATRADFKSELRKPVFEHGTVVMKTVWNLAEGHGNFRARNILANLTNPPVDRSPPRVAFDPVGTQREIREEAPPSYGSDAGTRIKNADVLPPQAWTSDPPARAWSLAGEAPVYWSDPPYTTREANAAEPPTDDPLTRRFSTSDVVNAPVAAARFRRSSAGSIAGD